MKANVTRKLTCSCGMQSRIPVYSVQGPGELCFYIYTIHRFQHQGENNNNNHHRHRYLQKTQPR